MSCCQGRRPPTRGTPSRSSRRRVGSLADPCLSSARPPPRASDSAAQRRRGGPRAYARLRGPPWSPS
eukprot:3678360-Pyramimonas_sp.AAC.1